MSVLLVNCLHNITVAEIPSTEHCRTVVSAPTLYLEGHGFESQTRDWLSWLRVSWFSSVTPNKHGYKVKLSCA